MELFFLVHDGSFRGSPGSAASTRRALSAVRVPPRPMILDLGCGIGDATLELLKATDGRVVALDLHEPYLRRLQGRARELGLQAGVLPLRASVHALPFASDKGPLFDLIWAEGSFYLLGMERSLEVLEPLLATGGHLAATELVWTVPADQRPQALVEFWSREYPEMVDLPTVRRRFQKAGYHVVVDFVLPDADWHDYYGPLQQRIQNVRRVLEGAGARPEALAMLAQMMEEIEVRRTHADTFGYCLVVGEKQPR